MAPRSQLRNNADALERLVKEEASYHTELTEQKARLDKTETGPTDDENHEYIIGQLKRAMDETRKVFPGLHEKIVEQAHKVKKLLESTDGSSENESEDRERAISALEAAKKMDIWQNAPPLDRPGGASTSTLGGQENGILTG